MALVRTGEIEAGSYDGTKSPERTSHEAVYLDELRFKGLLWV